MAEQESVLVSIRCLVYNHEQYLRKCLDGFVMQKTDFKYEVIIHDDASTDNSASIIMEYADKFPDIIKPIIEQENQYSKHDGSLRRIVNNACHGKYIALCEGDDYWTDPNKLQRQVDYLETHPDYSMCFHNAIEHWENSDRPDGQFSKIEDRDYLGTEFYEDWIIPTASTIMRKEVFSCDYYQQILSSIQNQDTRGLVLPGDILLFISCAEMGKVRGMSNVSSVYRRHDSGATTMMNYWGSIRNQYVFYNVLKEPYKSLAKQLFFKGAPNMYVAFRKNKEERRAILSKALKIDIAQTIKSFMAYFIKVILH